MAPGVPVTTAIAQKQDVPVLQRAIGTVVAFQSVLIRARVDGTLDKVLFTEGQMVKPGDLLAQLDPRPYQAILDEALAKKAADEANLVASQAGRIQAEAGAIQSGRDVRRRGRARGRRPDRRRPA